MISFFVIVSEEKKRELIHCATSFILLLNLLAILAFNSNADEWRQISYHCRVSPREVLISMHTQMLNHDTF